MHGPSYLRGSRRQWPYVPGRSLKTKRIPDYRSRIGRVHRPHDGLSYHTGFCTLSRVNKKKNKNFKRFATPVKIRDGTFVLGFLRSVYDAAETDERKRTSAPLPPRGETKRSKRDAPARHRVRPFRRPSAFPSARFGPRRSRFSLSRTKVIRRRRRGTFRFVLFV